MSVLINGGAGVTFPDGVQQTNAVTNTGGGPPYYAARAWVNFSAAGTVTIRASGNVSSIADNGTGNFTVNFASAMPDVNYTFNGSVWDEGRSSANQSSVYERSTSLERTINSFRISVTQLNTATYYDAPGVYIVVYR